MQRQCVDLRVHQRCERPVDQAMAFEAGPACEMARDDGQSVVATTGAGARMAGVAGRIVDELDRFRVERGQAQLDFLDSRHNVSGGQIEE